MHCTNSVHRYHELMDIQVDQTHRAAGASLTAGGYRIIFTNILTGVIVVVTLQIPWPGAAPAA